MRIGLIVDGDAEATALPSLFPALTELTGHTFLSPRKAAMHPTTTPQRNARACADGMAFLARKGAEAIVILIDLEERARCPVDAARAIQGVLASRTNVSLSVVVKNPMFENWLVADVEAFGHHPARFQISKEDAHSVSFGNADDVDAMAIIERSIRRAQARSTYQKVKDGHLLLSAANPTILAANSRSFRRFMRCIGHPDYLDQSRAPHRP